MAAMSDADRHEALRQYVKKIYTEDGATATLDTVQIRAAVDAVDDWVDANAASFNTALPSPFKTTATAGQKSLLLAFVAMKKYGVI